MFDAIRQFFSFKAAPSPAKGTGQQTLAPVTNGDVMPTVMTPKTVNKQVTLPSYVPTSTYIAAPLLRNDIRAATTDIASTARLGTTTQDTIRQMGRLNPDLSAAINAYLRVGIPEKYTVVARNMDGTFNRDATQLAISIIRQIDFMPDYASGFSQVSSLRSCAESLAKELLIEGGCSLELVLDKNRMPYKFQPISVSQIIFREDGDPQSIFAQQLIAGQYIDLDQPTFFYTSLDQDLLTPYAISPLEGAVQPVITAADFANDMRRILKRHVFPRYDVIIDEVKLRERIPQDILNDPDKAAAYLNDIVTKVQTTVNGMQPEDAIVHFDFFDVKQVEGPDAGQNAQGFETVKSIIDEKVSTGAKTLPSILGHGSGSQNVASTETMVFMLGANGMVRLKLQEIFSKAMTLAVRLFGQDVTVEFRYADIELRPQTELESFRQMKQARCLELLSLGFITDDEAALELTGRLTPEGFTSLQGTGFFSPITGGPGEQPNPNPLGNQQGALNQSLKPGTPTQAPGKKPAPGKPAPKGKP